MDESKNVVNEVQYESGDDDSLWEDVPSDDEKDDGGDEGYVGEVVDDTGASSGDEPTLRKVNLDEEDEDSDDEELEERKTATKSSPGLNRAPVDDKASWEKYAAQPEDEQLSVDSDSRAKDAVMSPGSHSAKSSDDSSSAASHGSEESGEPEEFYADLMEYPDGIFGYYLDAQTNYWFATYDKLSARQMKALLRRRGQSVSGTKKQMNNRLQLGDKRRALLLKTDKRFDKLIAHEQRITEWLALREKKRAASRERKSPPAAPASVPQNNAKEDEVVVEDASNSEAEEMDVDSDAEDLFKTPSSSKSVKKAAPSSQPLQHPAPVSGQNTPPATIATKSTASTAQSTVSSLNTPATVSSVTGRLLNQRPRRDATIDGIANYVSISCPPSKDKNADPAAACQATL